MGLSSGFWAKFWGLSLGVWLTMLDAGLRIIMSGLDISSWSNLGMLGYKILDRIRDVVRPNTGPQPKPQPEFGASLFRCPH